MRNRFREWYAPTVSELEQLWQNATFVLDSNILLGLYQYPASARDQFISVLSNLQNRLWLPHQVGLEYQLNRERSLPQQRMVLERLITNIESIAASVESLGLPEFHPVLDPKQFEAHRGNVKDQIDTLLRSVRADLGKTPRFSAREILAGDELRDTLTELYGSRVGERFSDDELESIFKEGAVRYQKSRPPGYKDLSKKEPHRYNDLIIWKEVLRAAEARPQGLRSTIFVTNDRKEDWWLRKDSEVLGPRPELVREYMDTVEGDFFMYTPGDFLTAAQVQLELDVSAETIEDVNRLSTTSAVRDALQFQRLILPELKARLAALNRIYESIESSEVRLVGDLNTVIERLGEQFQSNYVSTPLFFSLINETYGPLESAIDPARRLRERPVSRRSPAASREEFVRAAHTAWLAQAAFRVSHEDFSEEELLAEFFGDSSTEEARTMLRCAVEFADQDSAKRGSA